MGYPAVVSRSKLGCVLITGATGVIGSHLTEAVLATGADRVVCLYRSTNPRSYFATRGLASQVVIEPGDIRDAGRMREIVAKHQVTTIFHLAAQPLVTTAFRYPLDTIQANVIGTANILEAARLAGHVTALVVAASDKVYGAAPPPYHEEMALAPQHPYDASKAAADLLCRMYAQAYDVPVAIVRSANVYGPGDTNYDRIIPGIMKALITGDTLTVRSDATLVREYLYVADAAAGYMATARHIKIAQGEAYNFGSGTILSVRDLLEQVPEIVGRELTYTIANTATHEIPRQSLDFTKATKQLHWSPQWAFNDAIRKTYQWYQAVLKAVPATVTARA